MPRPCRGKVQQVDEQILKRGTPSIYDGHSIFTRHRMMNLSQPDPSMSAAVSAIDAVMQMDLTEDLLIRAIPLPTSTSKQQEFRLATEVRSRLGNPRAHAAMSGIDAALPKSVMECAPYLVTYKDNLRALINVVHKNLANEALEWAKIHLDEDAEEAASLCATEEGLDWLRKAADALFCSQNVSSRRKKMAHLTERFFDRLSAKVPRLADRIETMQVAYDHDACVLLAIEEIYGSMRPLALFALAMMYGHFILLGLLTSIGSSPFVLERVAESTLVDDEDFCESILEHSTILQELGPAGRILVYCDFDSVCDVGDVTRDHLDACLTLASLFKAEQDAHHRAQRQWAAHEKELNHLVSKQAKTIASLQLGNTKDATRAIMDELAAAKSEVVKLRATLDLKEERLAKLEKTRPEKSIKESPVEPSAIGPARTGLTAKEMSHDDALSFLNGLKGVLVGGHALFHAKIAQSLPSWSLFDADQVQIDDAHIQGADLVVFFTSHASHTQTQKVLKKTRQHEIPVAYAYKVNPASFFVEVAKQAQRVLTRNA